MTFIEWIKIYFKCMFIEFTRPRETTFMYKDKQVSRLHHMKDLHRALVKLI